MREQRSDRLDTGRTRYFFGYRRTRLVLAVLSTSALLTGAAAGVVFGHSTNQPAVDAGASSRWAAPSGSGAPASTTATPSSTNPTVAASSSAPPPSTAARPGTAPSNWPGPGNTGVPPRVALKASGSLTVTTNGTVIDRLDVTGCITVKARNVTIKRTRVRGTCDTGSISTPDSTDPGNVVIEDVEVDGLNQTTNNPLIAYSGFTCRRCNLHNGGTGIRMGHDVRVEDSWMHDSHTGGSSHNAGISGHGTSDFTLIHSRLECLDTDHCSSALSLYNDDGEIHDVLAQGNLFSGGGYCVYGGVFDKGPPGHNVRFLGNAFSRTPYPKCGQYGPIVFWSAGPGNQWSGNYWNDAARTPLVIEGGS